jgi:glucuronosyltransferase
MQELQGSIKLFLTNDHPAFTFPYLRPPNDIPVGCSNLLGTKNHGLEFSPEIKHFLERSPDTDIVYLSLGTYVNINDAPWYLDLVNILIELDLKVIVKVDEDSANKFPKSVLPLSWAPQKDLLRSGRIKLFISHCGNNGRLETIFYNVPVLCIPQYGDQPLNAEVIRVKGFGEVLSKEEITTHARDVVTAMISNHSVYHENMVRASDVVESEPGNVRDKLLFYVEYVAQHKNVDYLVNKVIKQQNLLQIYNLDIIFIGCLIVILILAITFYVLIKFCIYISRVIPAHKLKKQKSQ